MMQYFKQMGMAVALIVGLSLSTAASAANIGDCALTGYTFMGGNAAYTTPGSVPARDYFLTSSLNYDFDGMNMWGYGWVKFDNLATAPVTGAEVVFDLLGNGSPGMGNLRPASVGEPAILNVYDPGATDVADLGSSVPARSNLRDYLDNNRATALVGTLTMTSSGLYSMDITNLYNAWVADGNANHGLVFTAVDEGTGSTYASLGHATGTAPYITAVPEPATLGLLAVGGVAALRRRRA